MTNFDFLKSDERFSRFTDIAIAAEKVLKIDASSSVLNCRRAMEAAVKWMYSVDNSLSLPYQETLVTLINDDKFKRLVGKDTYKRMDFIRKAGNNVAHNTGKINTEIATLCLKNLFYFLDELAFYYSDKCGKIQHDFNQNLLNNSEIVDIEVLKKKDAELQELIEENKALKEELSARREEQQSAFKPNPLDISEYETRKIYIDFMLQDAGWKEGVDWQNEVELKGMPTDSGAGRADYVLYADDGKPLILVEAKRTCKDLSSGRIQANLYADLIEKQTGRRPIIFLTNGFETRIIDNIYPGERQVAGIYSKRDAEKFFNLQNTRISLKNISVNKNIAGRYYQEAAIKAVCDDLDVKKRRKSLLVMATGSGKTRTVIELCDILLQHSWVKNILFLADRTSLVTQAKGAFVNHLPNLSCSNLCEEKDNLSAHCIFSTYQTMANMIDSAKDDKGKLFTTGHFDLVICDEAHRSIYNKYRDIFEYFDSYLVGLTATPKDEIDKNTYEVFDLENGVPTFAYELASAVKEGYLVDFVSVETQLKFIEQGISYDDLTEDEKREYEETFTLDDGKLPDKINSTALNEWLFNKDTILKVLDTLMTNGLKVDYGQKIGKTIIFARNHNHAERIVEAFNNKYHLKDFIAVIDNYTSYAQSAIDNFSQGDKMPQIAVSVDMLDTGIDIPPILNLVFFKRVMSKAKFWQMIGRGTRLCPALVDGEDKKNFYIFDFCGNFEFFRMNKTKISSQTIALASALFNLRFQLCYKLQDIAYQNEPLIEFRKSLVSQLAAKVGELNRENFAVRQHLKYVELYSDAKNYDAITYGDLLEVKKELSSLILPGDDDVKAERFDALIYHIELAIASGEKYPRYKTELLKKVRSIASIANIPEIMVQKELIEKILHTQYLDSAGVSDFEAIRENLRNLMKYIPQDSYIYDTNFTDDILSTTWHKSNLESDDLKNYKLKAEYYIRKHQDNPVIVKLKTNKQLNQDDIKELEKILYSEVGTKSDYEAEFGQKPLGEFVREIVGLDMNAAKEAFSEYLDDTSLDDRQIYFVNQIIEYIVQNGILKDFRILQESPFSDRGSLIELFDDISLWNGIKKQIEMINSRVDVA